MAKASINPPVPLSGTAHCYSYSYGLMRLSKSIDQLPLLVLPHLRPLGTSVGGKSLGTGASCIVTAVLKPCGGCICATTSLRVCDLAHVYTHASLLPQLQKLQLCGSPLKGWHGVLVTAGVEGGLHFYINLEFYGIPGIIMNGQVKSSRGATRPRGDHPDPNFFLPPPLRG